jgi:amidase
MFALSPFAENALDAVRAEALLRQNCGQETAHSRRPVGPFEPPRPTEQEALYLPGDNDGQYGERAGRRTGGATGRMVRIVALAAAMALAAGAARAQPPYPLEEAPVARLQADMASGRVTSEALVRAYLARIETIDRTGPALHSVIALNPLALDQARALDAERRAEGPRGPLHGVPVLVKDNIETADPVPTTAGSLALKDNLAGRDAPIVARLRAAGAVILGKTNLSEWANIRSSRSISGWSAVGGLVKNPYALDRNACGSSSGSGAAVSASLAALAIGTETNGSVTCPASIDGVVGLKPTVGLLSRTHIVPISHTQDTAGPMGRSVADVAAMLTVMAGTDPADPATAEADAHRTDYVAALQGASLAGRRLGVLRPGGRKSVAELALFDRTLDALRAAGAVLVEVEPPSQPGVGEAEQLILQTELKADMAAYLATTPPAVRVRTLADLIAFDAATPRELALFGQETFEKAETTSGLDDPAYVRAKALAHRLTGPEGIDRMLADNRLDALVAETTSPAWRSDVVDGDNSQGSASGMAAMAGYPHLTVPMGQVRGLPVGLSFIGPAWSDARLLALGQAFEQAAHARRPPAYHPSVETDPEVAPLLAPVR